MALHVERRAACVLMAIISKRLEIGGDPTPPPSASRIDPCDNWSDNRKRRKSERSNRSPGIGAARGTGAPHGKRAADRVHRGSGFVGDDRDSAGEERDPS